MEFPGKHLFTKMWKSAMLSIALFIYINNEKDCKNTGWRLVTYYEINSDRGRGRGRALP